MKKIIILFSVVVMVSLGLFALTLLSFDYFYEDKERIEAEKYNLVTLDREVISPSGIFMATLFETFPIGSDDVRGYQIKIVDIKTSEEYIIDMHFRRRDVNYIVWAEDYDIIWAYSGDIGTYCWEFDDGNWIPGTYKESEKPKALKELRP